MSHVMRGNDIYHKQQYNNSIVQSDDDTNAEDTRVLRLCRLYALQWQQSSQLQPNRINLKSSAAVSQDEKDVTAIDRRSIRVLRAARM